ncbi:MAG: DUF2442 domain-containing protein [Planctomycetia bacterium]|nr:DUF2442 domain-containing protein [Planctomycetia bacterium]
MTELCATVTRVRVLDGYRLELTFSDGVRGVVDLANRIVGRGGVFAPLEAPEFFRLVVVHNELGTILWPNGADFCPDLLHRWATGEAVPRPEPETVASRPIHENG